MSIRDAKLTFGGGKKLGVQKLQGAQKAYKKNQTVKCLYFLVAPFEFSGRAPFKLVTPLVTMVTELGLGGVNYGYCKPNLEQKSVKVSRIDLYLSILKYLLI